MATDMPGFPPNVTPAPLSSLSNGVPGQIAADANYIYVCTAANTWRRVALTTYGTITLTYVSNGDGAGVFTYLGTVNGVWSNPHTSGAITLSSSTGVTGTIEQLVDHVSSNIYLGQVVGNWWQVDLGATHSLIVNKYSFRQRNAVNNFVVTMKLQGSNDNITYFDLTTADSPTATIDTWTSFDVPGIAASYRYFRIVRTALDSSGQNFFTAGEWELYGILTITG